MSDTTPPETDPRDLKIAEQAKILAELIKENQQFREENQQLAEGNKQLEKRIKRLEALLATKMDAKSSKKPVFTENYSLGRNKVLDPNKRGNQDSDNKPAKTSTGRKPREAKEHLVSDTIAVFPEGVDRRLCIHHRFQSAWRIVDGKALYLRYDIRDLPDSTSLPLPPGVRNSRCEFGMEVILILGFLHYWIGVSQENAIRIMNFFTGLDLSKSKDARGFGLLAGNSAAKQHMLGRRENPRVAGFSPDFPAGFVNVHNHLQSDEFGNGIMLLLPVVGQLSQQ